MTRKKAIIALAILNLVLLPFTLSVACSDTDIAAPADEEGPLLANSDMLASFMAEMEPGVDKMTILTDPGVIRTSDEPWMRDLVEVSHRVELAPSVVLLVYRELPFEFTGPEGVAFDQEPEDPDHEPTCIVEDVEGINIFQKGHRWRQFLQCMERAVNACGGFLKSDFDAHSYNNEEEGRVDFHGYVTCEEDPEGGGN